MPLTGEALRERSFAKFCDPAFDRDLDLFAEVGNAALALANRVTQIRSGRFRAPDERLYDPPAK